MRNDWRRRWETWCPCYNSVLPSLLLKKYEFRKCRWCAYLLKENPTVLAMRHHRTLALGCCMICWCYESITSMELGCCVVYGYYRPYRHLSANAVCYRLLWGKSVCYDMLWEKSEFADGLLDLCPPYCSIFLHFWISTVTNDEQVQSYLFSGLGCLITGSYEFCCNHDHG